MPTKLRLRHKCFSIFKNTLAYYEEAQISQQKSCAHGRYFNLRFGFFKNGKIKLKINSLFKVVETLSLIRVNVRDCSLPRRSTPTWKHFQGLFYCTHKNNHNFKEVRAKCELLKYQPVEDGSENERTRGDFNPARARTIFGVGKRSRTESDPKSKIRRSRDKRLILKSTITHAHTKWSDI